MIRITDKYWIQGRGQKNMKENAQRTYTPDTLIFLFFLFSVSGWLWEVGYHLVEDRAFINRGFLTGPWLPIYGAGGVLILLLLKRFFDRPGLLFLMIMGVCGVVEYLTGWALETMFHQRWWDYSEYVFQIQGRVCLIGLLIFGAGGLAFVYGVAPWMDFRFHRIGSRLRRYLCMALVVLFVADMCYSLWHPNHGVGITSPVQAILAAGY